MSLCWLDWPAPASVKACYTLRSGGSSSEPYLSFNLGDHVGDNPQVVQRNRSHLSQLIKRDNIAWLTQVHGTDILHLPTDTHATYEADASITQQAQTVCCVMTADCLPVFFCDQQGQQVAIAHAGWRGLLNGVLQKTLAHFTSSDEVLLYLGPAISQQAFEVGEEVRKAFLNAYPLLPELNDCFLPSPGQNQKWMADIYRIARIMMSASGVTHIYGGDRCTYTETSAFFSYRRDNLTGRMANLIWIDH